MECLHRFGWQHDQDQALWIVGRHLQLQRQHVAGPGVQGVDVELGLGLGGQLLPLTHQFLTAVQQSPSTAEAIAQEQRPLVVHHLPG
jgi:hypothetical protein